MKESPRERATRKVSELPNFKEKRTLLGIANWSDEYGDGCWAKVNSIAKYACVSERQVQRDLSKLQEMGHVTIEYQAKKGYRTNLYHITCCRLTTDEREQIPHYAASDVKQEKPIFIARNQMKLPIEEKPELSNTTVTEITPEAQRILERFFPQMKKADYSPARLPKEPEEKIPAPDQEKWDAAMIETKKELAELGILKES